MIDDPKSAAPAPETGNDRGVASDAPDQETGKAGSIEESGLDPAALAAVLATEVETLKGQIADLTDRLLRAHAEMDNLRKRAERDREETAKYAVTKFARDIVGVGDNFQRAINAVPPGAADQDAALKSFLEGVVMSERAFLNVLERHGITQINPAGQPFNPHQHQAMLEQENPAVPAGTVLQVFESGYLLQDRVLRPAMVMVSKGGPKSGRPPSDGSDTGAGSETSTVAAEAAGNPASAKNHTNSRP